MVIEPEIASRRYPANPYITEPPQINPAPFQRSTQMVTNPAPEPQASQAPLTFPEQAGGYWTAPSGGGGGGGAGWAQQMYSPQFLEAMRSIYGQLPQQIQQTQEQWQAAQPQPTAGRYEQYMAGVQRPEELGWLSQLYGQGQGMLGQTRQDWQANQPEALAGQYRQFMEGSPELEQMEYNRATARLRGAIGAGQQNLMTLAGARRGGAQSGMFNAGLEDLNRALMAGTGEIATQQAMQQIQDRERRMQQYLGYQQGDIANRLGWLQGMTGAEQGMFGALGNVGQAGGQQALGWQGLQDQRMQQLMNAMQGDVGNQLGWLQGMTNANQGAMGQYTGFLGQMLPYEQFNIQFPQQMALQNAQLGLSRAGLEEQINAARREEAMGWWDRLMAMQGQLGSQYYTGQGQWGNYQGQRGQSILGGYGPQWLGYWGV